MGADLRMGWAPREVPLQLDTEYLGRHSDALLTARQPTAQSADDPA